MKSTMLRLPSIPEWRPEAGSRPSTTMESPATETKNLDANAVGYLRAAKQEAIRLLSPISPTELDGRESNDRNAI